MNQKRLTGWPALLLTGWPALLLSGNLSKFSYVQAYFMLFNSQIK